MTYFAQSVCSFAVILLVRIVNKNLVDIGLEVSQSRRRVVDHEPMDYFFDQNRQLMKEINVIIILCKKHLSIINA